MSHDYGFEFTLPTAKEEPMQSPDGKNDYDRIDDRLQEIIMDISSAYHSPKNVPGDSVTILKDDLLHIINETARLKKWVAGLSQTHKSAKRESR